MFVVVAAGMMFGLTSCGPKAFNTASLNTEDDYQSQASTYWKKEGWWSLPAGTKKIAITEFSVEYVTKTGSQDYNAGLIAMAQLAGVGKKEYKFDEQMKQTLPTELYKQYVAELTKRGYEVLPSSALWNTPTYKKITTTEQGGTIKTGQSTGNVFSDRVGRSYQHGQVYVAADTIIVDMGFFASFGNPMGKEMAAVGEAGADTGLHIRIKAGIDDKGRAVLWPGSIIMVYAGVNNANSADNPVYVSKTTGSVVSKEMLYFSDPVINSKEFEAFKGDIYDVQPGPYADAVKKVFPKFAALSIYSMRK
ncbi:MAG: hypothetical protein GC162_16440 [Planctomycetes bacterium]|nr:hypothetical protein [Planctomycetota bacterium]